MSIHFNRELEKVKRLVSGLAGEVERTLSDALSVPATRDSEIVLMIHRSDAAIDQKEVEIEEECLKMLALYKPMAGDLRYIIAVLKMNSDLERISNIAVHFADVAKDICEQGPLECPFDLQLMGTRVRDMLRASLDALVDMNVRMAYEVCKRDAEINAMDRDNNEVVCQEIVRTPHHAPVLQSFSTLSRFLERIADHAANIAEETIYHVEGKIIRHWGASPAVAG